MSGWSKKLHVIFGLLLKTSIKSSVSQMHFHPENERVLRLSVSSAAIPSLPIIFILTTFPKTNQMS